LEQRVYATEGIVPALSYGSTRNSQPAQAVSFFSLRRLHLLVKPFEELRYGGFGE